MAACGEQDRDDEDGRWNRCITAGVSQAVGGMGAVFLFHWLEGFFRCHYTKLLTLPVKALDTPSHSMRIMSSSNSEHWRSVDQLHEETPGMVFQPSH